MLLDINEIGDEPVAFDREIDLSALGAEDPSIHDVRDVRLVGRAFRGERGLCLEGRLTATIELACGRCLEWFDGSVSEDFFLTAVAGAMESGSGEIEVTEEDAELLYVETGKVDFREIAHEQLYLSLPLKPLCRAACQGLCPTCGVNRNRIECGCPSQDLDPRLAPLLELKTAASTTKTIKKTIKTTKKKTGES